MKIKLIALLLLTTFFSTAGYAEVKSHLGLTPSEQSLKDFGFSYCLSFTDDSSLKDESSLALGGYFQAGDHDEVAYTALRQHINVYLKINLKSYQETRAPSYLMTCLELYNSKDYNQLVKQL